MRLHAREPRPNARQLAVGEMERFLARRTEATDMHEGAVVVHDAIGNESNAQSHKDEKPKQREAKKIPAGHHECTGCNTVKPKEDGYMMGRKRTSFRCKACNAFDHRVSRLTRDCKAGTLWRDLPDDAKAAFRLEKAQLEAAALKEELSVILVQRYIEIHQEDAGQRGEYRPLSWYKAQGYEKAMLDHIADTCPKRKEGATFTYKYDVHYEGRHDMRQNITETIWKPLPKMGKAGGKDAPSKEVQSSSSSSDDDTSSSASEDVKKRQRKSAAKLEAREKNVKRKQPACAKQRKRSPGACLKSWPRQ